MSHPPKPTPKSRSSKYHNAVAEAASRAPMPPEKRDEHLSFHQHGQTQRRKKEIAKQGFGCVPACRKGRRPGKSRDISDNEDSDLRIADGVMDARKFLKDQDYLGLGGRRIGLGRGVLGSERRGYDVLNSKFSPDDP